MTTAPHPRSSFADLSRDELLARRAQAKRRMGTAFVLLILLAVGTPLVVLSFPLHKSNPLPLIIGFPVVLVVSVVFMAVSAARLGKLQTACTEAEMLRLGFSFVSKPRSEAKPAIFVPFAHLKKLRTGARGIQWYATGQVRGSGRPVQMIQHMYMVSTGKSAHAVNHVVATCHVPNAWPSVALTARTFWHRLFGTRGFKLDSSAFNERWRVSCSDEGFVPLLLTPQVQQWLLTAPRNESWEIGQGWISCIRHTKLDAEQVEEMVMRPVLLANMIPPELEAWGT